MNMHTIFYLNMHIIFYMNTHIIFKMKPSEFKIYISVESYDETLLKITEIATLKKRIFSKLSKGSRIKSPRQNPLDQNPPEKKYKQKNNFF